MIFILLKVYPYELSEIHGVYSTKQDAEEAENDASLEDAANDNSASDHHYEIEEHEIQ